MALVVDGDRRRQRVGPGGLVALHPSDTAPTAALLVLAGLRESPAELLRTRVLLRVLAARTLAMGLLPLATVHVTTRLV